MKHLKILGLAVIAIAMALAAFGAGGASATRLYKYTSSGSDPLGSGDTYTTAMGPGLSFLVKDTNGGTTDTCTGFHEHGHISTVSGHTTMAPTSFVYTGCTHSTIIIKFHTLEIKHIAGTTNGTIVAKGGETTIQSTIFGASCIAKTGAGTTIGTLTGAKSSTGQASIDYNGVISMGICGDAVWTGTGTISSPLGLMVEAS